MVLEGPPSCFHSYAAAVVTRLIQCLGPFLVCDLMTALGGKDGFNIFIDSKSTDLSIFPLIFACVSLLADMHPVLFITQAQKRPEEKFVFFGTKKENNVLRC